MQILFVKTFKAGPAGMAPPKDPEWKPGKPPPVLGPGVKLKPKPVAKVASDPGWRQLRNYGGTGNLFGGLARDAKTGRFASASGETPDEAVAGLTPADYAAGQSFAKGGAIDDATMERLAKAGLLQIHKGGIAIMSAAGRESLMKRQGNAAELTKQRKAAEAEAKKAEAEGVKKAKKAEADGIKAKKAGEADAKRKVANDEKLKKQRESEAAKKKAIVDKDAAKAQLVKDKAEEAAANEETQRVTMAETSEAAGLAKAEVNTLLSFVKGDDIEFESPMGMKLEKLGMLNILPGEKRYVTGGTASAFLNAAMTGNVRGAKDIVSTAVAQRRAQEAKVIADNPVAAITTPVGGEAGRILVPAKRYTPTLRKKELRGKKSICFPFRKI